MVNESNGLGLKSVGRSYLLLFVKAHNQRTDRVGLYSVNRAEWMLTSHGADMHTLTIVPLYDTLGPEVVQFITNLVKLKVIFCSGDKVDTVSATLFSCVWQDLTHSSSNFEPKCRL